MRVIIRGVGLAGMCAAYELGKLGYDCQILEARNRPGGRCWPVRILAISPAGWPGHWSRPSQRVVTALHERVNQ